MLKTRLLGRGKGRLQSQQGKKRGAAADSESEEELGRSAVGKSKLNESRKRARVEGMVPVGVDGEEGLGAGGGRSVVDDRQTAESGGDGDVGEGEGDKKSADDITAGEGDTSLGRTEGTGEEKGEKRKKKKKKKRSKKVEEER